MKKSMKINESESLRNRPFKITRQSGEWEKISMKRAKEQHSFKFKMNALVPVIAIDLNIRYRRRTTENFPKKSI